MRLAIKMCDIIDPLPIGMTRETAEKQLLADGFAVGFDYIFVELSDEELKQLTNIRSKGGIL